MKIITVPNPTLKKVSTPVEVADKKLATFIADLEKTLVTKKNPEGVGLSAPQVAKNWRIFSIYLDHTRPNSVETLVNPVIVSASRKMSLGGSSQEKPFLEGCLSIPQTFGPVWRHHRITLEYFELDLSDLKLIPRSKKFKGFPARVVQHEMDHLDGILFTDRALEQGLPLYREAGGELVEIGRS